jgi:hypothetical protein
MDEIEFIRDDPAEAAARTATELTGWELVVFELADEEESGE